MLSLLVFVATTLLALPAKASFEGNLNYASPSWRHSNLGIDVSKVELRSWKRGNVAHLPSELRFTHGIASGDPWPDSVILWTRVAPTNESDASEVTVSGTAPLYNHATEPYIEADPNPICVEWKVLKSKCANSTENVVASGKAYTTSDIDYTVEAGGLSPFTSYYYQFTVCDSNNSSPFGKTKTAPLPDDDVSNINLAVFSCSNFPNGYFNAYGNAARKNQHDYVIHLGDYIYEYAANGEGERSSLPRNEIFTLHDYRTRHGQYRTDPDLQLLAENYPWITTWDDHEFANNGYRDGFSGLNNTEESFLNDGPQISVDTRKVNAVRAYFEWMPIRCVDTLISGLETSIDSLNSQTDLDDGLRIWRSFQLGKLLDLVILDTRNYDRSITGLGWNNAYIDRIRDDPARTLMGSRQENWFYRSLSESKTRGATWRVVGSQIIISRVFENDAGQLSRDNWNGYISNRNRTLKHIYDNDINNNIFLAGDSHQNWVSDLAWLGTKDYDSESGSGAMGVEFAGTAVSSTGQRGPIEPTAGNYARNMLRRNEEMMWQEGYYRGYFILGLTPEKATAQFYGSPSVATRNPWDLPLANFTVVAGENRLQRPVGGGVAESGALRDGEIKHSNLTYNTETKEWDVVSFERMFI
ncbi:Alkaline phosphatase D [Paramyrothecium foliicola]|nr:Alkaline phosphatase D [Paramyrothecium foliicola]